MTHRRAVLLVVRLCVIAVLLPGCVPVTEPLSDPDKAEPDKRLLGTWQSADCPYEIDAPPVKGNPKGLMRALRYGRADNPQNIFWFFTTTIGKHTYATIYVESYDKWGNIRYADFRKEGAFKKWNEKQDRHYFIVRLVLDGDKVTVDGGDDSAEEKLNKAMPAHKTPWWLAKYLEKNGPQIYNGTNEAEYRRSKK